MKEIQDKIKRAKMYIGRFKELKLYAHTQNYKEVIRECGYFDRYIRAGK